MLHIRTLSKRVVIIAHMHVKHQATLKSGSTHEDHLRRRARCRRFVFCVLFLQSWFCWPFCNNTSNRNTQMFSRLAFYGFRDICPTSSTCWRQRQEKTCFSRIPNSMAVGYKPKRPKQGVEYRSIEVIYQNNLFWEHSYAPPTPTNFLSLWVTKELGSSKIRILYDPSRRYLEIPSCCWDWDIPKTFFGPTTYCRLCNSANTCPSMLMHSKKLELMKFSPLVSRRYKSSFESQCKIEFSSGLS